MNSCPSCKGSVYRGRCTKCGEPIVSDPNETLENLVTRNSTPNLAALFRAGKKAGLIKPVADYEGVPSA